MPRLMLFFVTCLAVFATLASAQLPSQSSTRPNQAHTRMRPIGSTSAVDRIRAQNDQWQGVRQSGPSIIAPVQRRNGELGRRDVRQVVMMQQDSAMTAPPIPNDVGTAPSDPNSSSPRLPSRNVDESAPPPNAAMPSLPMKPSNALPINSSPSDRRSGDFQQVPRPQLNNNGFATIDNCNCISGPSTYAAASGIGCGSNAGLVQQVGCNSNIPGAGYGLQPYAAPPAQLAAPAVMPQFPVASGGFSQGGLGFPNGLPRSLISFGQQLNTVQVGQGIVGQPVAYVPGQTLRNWLRYIFP